MRTRRSPNNQERLWRELGNKPEPQPKFDRVEQLERILANQMMNPRTRRQLERDLVRAKAKAASKANDR